MAAVGVRFDRMGTGASIANIEKERERERERESNDSKDKHILV